jgi:hypothetical protein
MVDKKADNRSLDYIFEDNVPYPNVDMGKITLPIAIDRSGLKEILLIPLLGFFLYVFVKGLLIEGFSGFHSGMIVSGVLIVSMLIGLALSLYRLANPVVLIIDKDGIQYRPGRFNLGTLQPVSYANIYGAYYSNWRTRNGRLISYLNLPLVDGHHQAMKNLTKDNHLKIELHRHKEEALHLVSVTKVLMTRYHESHDLVGSLPVLTVIEQK